MKIIIEDPVEWIGKLGYSVEGRYKPDQIEELIYTMLLHRGITASIKLDYGIDKRRY